ncbi:MAG: chromate transporter [Clostridia bacterium]|nr:chromate transporter [Clostridia bacterium]
MIYLTLFLEFFKTGLFAIGGGMATLPFLYDLTKYGWYTMPELMDMIAVAESTPGPIGVNMAAYAGFSAGGLLGGVVSTIGLVMPSVIVIILVYKVLEKFKNTPLVETAFYGLRPAVAGMIVVACSELFKLSILKSPLEFSLTGIINIKATILFLIVAFAIMKFKKIHPIVFILFGAVFGIIFKL